ncbi:MAG: Crp/Fnr family transcriptional regulator [Firmicutes bacterium]|nr:Crp/Fnr family transcriptional regulator [Bacillota bacterium]
MDLFQLPIFQGVSREAWEDMRAQGCVLRRRFEKGAYVFRTGDSTRQIGIVCTGSVRIESNDLWGNRSILSAVAPGQVFAESYAICGIPMMVDAVAAEDSDIAFLCLEPLLKRRDSEAYPRILENLLRLSAQKNLTLSNRIFCTTAKTIRGRLVTYLSAQAAKNGSMDFFLPFDRQQMADYLNVDRSALSKELCRMREEGMLRFHKNHFTLLKMGEPGAPAPDTAPPPL